MYGWCTLSTEHARFHIINIRCSCFSNVVTLLTTRKRNKRAFYAMDMVVFCFFIKMYDQLPFRAYLPGGSLPVVMMAGDPRGSRLLLWARPWSAAIPGELHSCCLYRIIFYRGGVACGPPNTHQQPPTLHRIYPTPSKENAIDAPSPEGRSWSLGEDDIDRIVLIA